MTRFALPFAAAALAHVVTPAAARDYGQAGALFPIAEQDLLAVIHARLTHLEQTGATARLNEELKRRTVAKVNRPVPVEGLGPAEHARSWLFDPAITLEDDIADDKGRVILTRGTRVNPLDTVPLRAALLFFDGDDPAQLAWALARARKAPAKLILVKGAPLELMRSQQQRFYFDQGGTLTHHFAIQALPALVEQQGRALRVSELALPPTRRPQL
ncbi:MAG: type-F conjugative transfer system protein TraW [Novosphingobium sp.]